MRRDSTGLMPVLVDPVRGTVEPVFAKGRKPTHEAASSPSGVAFAPTLGLWAGGFVMANAATYRIGLYDWNGVLKEVVAREPKAGRLSKDRVDYMLAEMRSGDSPFAKMPVADLRSRIEATVVPPFSPTAEVEADASGRLWVFGIEADSAFADVFTPKGFLGTLHIGCLGFEGRASVQGNWLAVVCRPREETADVAAVIRLFKIR